VVRDRNAISSEWVNLQFNDKGEIIMPLQEVGKKAGKGGNFETRNNPFGAKGISTARPNLADVPSVGAVIDSILLGGAAVMLGSTRDGGAVVITVFDGEQRHRTYCSNERELENAFASLQAAYTEL